ncbi:MAG: pyridoxal-phosphate dependent enzyme [Anaerolineae bacterium]|nr:pyridoxal-phosphate dependent enzyme [Anaerolineae bacterium]
MSLPVTPEDVAAAAQRLAGIAHHTPVLTSRSLNQICGRDIFLKGENFQRVGAFKFRGAYNAVSQLTLEQKKRGVVTHSSGNHAQGLALAAHLLHAPATIVMPDDAPAVKQAATASYGANIVTCAAAERETISTQLAQEHGYTLIHPYDHDHIIAGAGTAAWELFQDVGPLDLLFVPVGGGGLISGSALAAAHLAPTCRVIGVEPASGNDANISWREGRIHTLPQVPTTIADGLRTRFVGQRNLAIMRQYVHDMLTVSEEAIVETMYFLWTRLKIVVEPSAAVALAPLFTGSYPGPGQRVGILLSGGNVDVRQLPFVAAPSESVLISQPAPRPVSASAPDDQPRILVCDPIAETALATLRQFATVDLLLEPDQESLQNQISQYDALIVGERTRVGGRVIEQAFKLRAIGCTGPSLDNVDVSSARAFGLAICYHPSSNAVAVAEHTLNRMLTLAGRDDELGEGLAGKTLGIIGFGRIGRQVAQRALAFEMRVLVNQPRLTPELALQAGVTATDLVPLLQEADFVSLHVPFKLETQTLIGSKELALMKPTAYLINTAHTELVDAAALLHALEQRKLAGAALASFTPRTQEESQPPSVLLQQNPHTIPARHVTEFMKGDRHDAAAAVCQQIAAIFKVKRPSETLSLEVVPTELVTPHEQIDDKRVSRLMQSLTQDDQLVNPPITVYWEGRYIILDGATRFTAMQRLGFPAVIVQIADTSREGFALHTWYHAISAEQTAAALYEHLRPIPNLQLESLPTEAMANIFQDDHVLCYFLERQGKATVARVIGGGDKLVVMNALVAQYTTWGQVERTLLTDTGRLLAQFPQMVAVAVFPQFTPETVFTVASQGDLLPAGLTRFVIPGRILRLNADLQRLKQDEPLSVKRAWFNEFLKGKLARSRLRYYQEPVVLLDE